MAGDASCGLHFPDDSRRCHMFDRLVNDAASRLELPVASVSALLREVLSLITNERTGGVQGFFDLFRRAGLGDVLTSSFSGKEGRPVTASQLESGLWEDP